MAMYSFKAIMHGKAGFHQQVRFDSLNSLPLASFGGTRYSFDETGVMQCVFKAWCVCPREYRGKAERRPLPR
jgi:hypothetical protein